MNDLPYALPIPYRDPLDAFAAFADEKNVAFLDSAAETGGRGRYSYIAADPYQVLTGAETIDPFDALEAELNRFPMRNDPDLPPLQGSAVGYLSYELGRHLERLPPLAGPGLEVAGAGFGLYDTLAAFARKSQFTP